MNVSHSMLRANQKKARRYGALSFFVRIIRSAAFAAASKAEIGIILMFVGVLGMFVFGYASWRGRQNVTLVIEDYEKKISEIKKIDKNASGTEKIRFK